MTPPTALASCSDISGGPTTNTDTLTQTAPAVAPPSGRSLRISYDRRMSGMLVDGEALRALGVKLLVLFGSRARATARPSSDVDLGVVLDEPHTRSDALAGKILDAVRADGEPDLVFLNEAEPLLLHEVAVSGKALYERSPGAMEEFRVRAVMRYYDTAWIRRIEAEALRRRYA